MKKVIYWEPKRTEKRKLDGTIVTGEYVGKFRTKVDAGTLGSIRHHGTLANGKEYDYTGLDVDSIAGKLRWIDKQDNGEFGTNLVLFLESDKYLHRISIKYDPYNLKDVMNHLCGLGKDIASHVINLSYWVRKAKTNDGQFKVKDNGDPVWNKSLSFRDMSPQFTFDQWKDFAQTNGLEWVQVKKANGKTEWVSDNEYKYWDSRLLAVQRFLLKEGTALPFMYNSMIGCESPNPSGGGNLTKEEIIQCNEIYERIRSEYSFPFGRTELSADDAFDAPQPSTPAPIDDFGTPPPHPSSVLGNKQPAFVDSEGDAFEDDLPF